MYSVAAQIRKKPQRNQKSKIRKPPVLTTSLELDSVDEDDDKGPDEEFEECLLRVSEVLFLGFPSASLSSVRLLLHLSSCWLSTIKVTPLPIRNKTEASPHVTCYNVLGLWSFGGFFKTPTQVLRIYYIQQDMYRHLHTYVLLIPADTRVRAFVHVHCMQHLAEGLVVSRQDPLMDSVKTMKHHPQVKMEIGEARHGRSY